MLSMPLLSDRIKLESLPIPTIRALKNAGEDYQEVESVPLIAAMMQPTTKEVFAAMTMCNQYGGMLERLSDTQAASACILASYINCHGWEDTYLDFGSSHNLPNEFLQLLRLSSWSLSGAIVQVLGQRVAGEVQAA